MPVKSQVGSGSLDNFPGDGGGRAGARGKRGLGPGLPAFPASESEPEQMAEAMLTDPRHALPPRSTRGLSSLHGLPHLSR